MAVAAVLVAQGDGEAGVGRAFGEFDVIQLCINLCHRAKKIQHLVHEVAAKVTQQTAGGAGL